MLVGSRLRFRATSSQLKGMHKSTRIQWFRTLEILIVYLAGLAGSSILTASKHWSVLRRSTYAVWFGWDFASKVTGLCCDKMHQWHAKKTVIFVWQTPDRPNDVV